jgi:predicted MFS family arabinose efflux permease
VFWQISGTLPLWLVQNLGFSERFFGLALALNTLMIVLLEVPLNLAMARWPHRRQLALGAWLVGTGFGLTGLVRTRGAVLLTLALWTIGEMILFPAVADAVATLAPEHRRGEYMGLHALAFAVAVAGGPWLGMTAYACGDTQALWAGSFLLGCISTVSLSRFKATGAPAPSIPPAP